VIDALHRPAGRVEAQQIETPVSAQIGDIKIVLGPERDREE